MLHCNDVLVPSLLEELIPPHRNPLPKSPPLTEKQTVGAVCVGVSPLPFNFNVAAATAFCCYRFTLLARPLYG